MVAVAAAHVQACACAPVKVPTAGWASLSTPPVRKHAPKEEKEKRTCAWLTPLVQQGDGGLRAVHTCVLEPHEALALEEVHVDAEVVDECADVVVDLALHQRNKHEPHRLLGV